MIEFDCRLDRDRFVLDAAFEGDAGVTALFGASGSGKSTIIRLIAGLERPQRGRVVLDGRPLLDTSTGISLPPWRRRIGLVFQDAKLFPHLSVRQNLTYGRYFAPKREAGVDFDTAVQVLGIDHLLGQHPHTLSGGERQRVGIGRALLAAPQLLLMDEPLASLDADRKLEILPFVERLRDELHVPILYVSHAVEEVARLASRVVRLEQGRVVAVGPPGQVLGPSAVTRGVDRFDVVSTLKARFVRYDAEYGVSVLTHPSGEIIVPAALGAPAQDVRITIHATNVALAIGRPGQISFRTALLGQVTSVETDASPFALVTLELAGGEKLRAYVTRLAIADLGIDAGDTVHALLKSVSIDERGVSGLRIATRSNAPR